MIYEEDVDEFLAHYGVRGQKWGVRKARRQAGKDAKEFARAKMFYGEGAGTRRKLIKATVESKSKKDPTYKKHFEESLATQDLGKHGAKARSERKRKDTGKKTKQSLGAIARRSTGEMGTVAAITALGVAGAAFANSPKGRRMMETALIKFDRNVVNNRHVKNGVKYVKDLLRR